MVVELRASPLSSAVPSITDVLVSFLLQITLTALIRTFEVQTQNTLQGSDSDATSEKDGFSLAVSGQVNKLSHVPF